MVRWLTLWLVAAQVLLMSLDALRRYRERHPADVPYDGEVPVELLERRTEDVVNALVERYLKGCSSRREALKRLEDLAVRLRSGHDNVI